MGCTRDERGRLCCDACGQPPARRYKCPWNYCIADILCKACATKHKAIRTKAAHRERGCEKNHNEFVAREAFKAKLLSEGKKVRCSALMIDTGEIHVLFRGTDGIEGRYMPDQVYSATKLMDVTTIETYEEINGGPLPVAPVDFVFKTDKELSTGFEKAHP